MCRWLFVATVDDPTVPEAVQLSQRYYGGVKWRVIIAVAFAIALAGSFQAMQSGKPTHPARDSLSTPVRYFNPMAGCDNGVPVANVAIGPNGPTVSGCTQKGPPSQVPLPPAQDPTFELGTVVIVALSNQQLILAADSRSGLVRFENNLQAFDRTVDDRCKLIQLSPTVIFAAAGRTRFGDQSESFQNLPGQIFYDAQALATEAVAGYKFDPQWMTSPNESILSIAEIWAWNMDFRIRHGLEKGLYGQTFPARGQLFVQGFFAGVELNGDISFAEPILTIGSVTFPGGVVGPPVTILIPSPVPPMDGTWIEAFGRSQVATSYVEKQPLNTATSKVAVHQRIRDAVFGPTDKFPPSIIEQLVKLTYQEDSARYPDGSRFVGGPVDMAKLTRKGVVQWIQRKKGCGTIPNKDEHPVNGVTIGDKTPLRYVDRYGGKETAARK
ncbi:MAG TPA: hypothetical protein VJN96_13040 [Vicinamibacterales bacterium]|nr:hypothetical protein [Vicinamibacterales bacterium]